MKRDYDIGIFEAAGIELEYMLVDGSTLDVAPRADELLEAVAGEIVSEIEVGPVAWSNELVLHVIELKTNGPAADLVPYAGHFQTDVRRINEILRQKGLRLMPTGMHPWMDPKTETVLWPHESSPIYEAFDRIFGCEGHGWSNLQSLHINLPFANDEEFAKLHAAIRLVLPILPALAASSPIVEGRITGSLDSRMNAYRGNAAKVPSVGGEIVPEPVFSRAEYEREILGRMYDEIGPHDPQGVLRHEFLNSRGAIARFVRGSIEIRVIDVQECPLADLAIAAATIALLRAVAEERWSSLEDQKRADVPPLAAILRRCVDDGENAMIDVLGYLKHFGVKDGAISAGDLWSHVVDQLFQYGLLAEEPWREPLETILARGSLSTRILRALSGRKDRDAIREIYARLCDALENGRMFDAG